MTSRCDAQGAIFSDDEDRLLFLALLEEAVVRFGWLCHAYCLMGNHYHLLIGTPDSNLSLGMRQLNGVYTQRFNRRHARVGHLFQGQFEAILVDRDSYLLELCRYVVLNPVRAKMVKDINRHPWSSYLATARSQPAPSPWLDLKGQILLGSEQFEERMQPFLKEKSDLKEIPRGQRLAHQPSLKALFPAKVRAHKQTRDEVIRRAYIEYGYTMAAIARQSAIHYSTVSKVIRGKR